jgi:hypothetical protein
MDPIASVAQLSNACDFPNRRQPMLFVSRIDPFQAIANEKVPIEFET